MSRPRVGRIALGVAALAAAAKLLKLAHLIHSNKFIYPQLHGKRGWWKYLALLQRASIDGLGRSVVFTGEIAAVLTSPRLALHLLRLFSRSQPTIFTRNLRYGPRPRNHVDVHLPGGSNKTGMPIIVFVHGGAWSWGQKFHCATMCNTLSRGLSCIVVNTNYSVYPTGSVDEMVEDVQQALVWASDNADAFGGDRHNMHVCGHSAGGHLAAMALLRPAADERSATVLRQVKGCIAMSAVLDVDDHYDFEASRQYGPFNGVATMSPMAPAMGCGGVGSFSRQSPTQLVSTPRASELHGRTAATAPLFTMIHGEVDTTVPTSSSTKFADALAATGVRHKVVIVPGATHMSVVLDLMIGDGRGDCDALLHAFAQHLKSTSAGTLPPSPSSPTATTTPAAGTTAAIGATAGVPKPASPRPATEEHKCDDEDPAAAAAAAAASSGRTTNGRGKPALTLHTSAIKILKYHRRRTLFSDDRFSHAGEAVVLGPRCSLA